MHTHKQVLFKSAKVIPVMIMGRVLNKSKYPMVEYIEAVVITVGVATFGLSKPRNNTNDPANTEVRQLQFMTNGLVPHATPLASVLCTV